MTAINKTTLQQILDTVQELHNLEQIVTREAVREATGLALTTVDDRLATLVDRGDITRIGRGVFVPAVRHPPARPISKTQMPDGTVKIEIGDDVLTLTPREDRILARLQAGVAVELAAIDSGKEVAVLIASMRTRIGRLEAQLDGFVDGGLIEGDGLAEYSSAVASAGLAAGVCIEAVGLAFEWADRTACACACAGGEAVALQAVRSKPGCDGGSAGGVE